MQEFHVVIDTSMLRQMHFRHPNFERILLQARKGVLKIYIPRIVLEEERTYQLALLIEELRQMNQAFKQITKRKYEMLVQGLPAPIFEVWTKEEIDQNSREMYDKFLADNKIEVIPFSMEHANNAWGRYFNVDAPFNAEEDREERRKDIPDSWILEAALEIRSKPGACALVADGRLKKALDASNFKIFDSAESLIKAIEEANQVISLVTSVGEHGTSPHVTIPDQVFEEMRTIVLGMNEGLGSPSKESLFGALQSLGLDRKLAEHEAERLVLSGILIDTGGHYIPQDRHRAATVAQEPIVQKLLIKYLE